MRISIFSQFNNNQLFKDKPIIKKVLKNLIDKIKKKQLTEYIFWKFGISKYIKFLRSPILYSEILILKIMLKLSKNFPKLYIKTKYRIIRKEPSDIFQHIDTLYYYALQSNSIFETGVRGVVSSWAFLYGLYRKNNPNSYYLMNDIVECESEEILLIAKKLNIETKFIVKNNLELNFDQTFDLTFIDTWHIYGQLIRELNKFSVLTNKYMILHDTTIDAEKGESIRFNQDLEALSQSSGFTIEEISKGLWPAVEEFLNKNDNWKLSKRYMNNNGLTILEKIN